MEVKKYDEKGRASLWWPLGRRLLFIFFVFLGVLWLTWPYCLVFMDESPVSSARLVLLGRKTLLDKNSMGTLPLPIYCGIGEYSSFHESQYKSALSDGSIAAAEIVITNLRTGRLSAPQAAVLRILPNQAEVVFSSTVLRWEDVEPGRPCVSAMGSRLLVVRKTGPIVTLRGE